ncbi:uncharacterized protein LOC123555603 [Mercenaria mercenaria]|uniref:uncharacterized protein LOC123555603 n=1 Tax=Mercenaria mercenaria TaxID=6596 RepID=UPI00234EF887|nr:uncharacterized protein LOC123555603 [Mercenaria mercenaria]
MKSVLTFLVILLSLVCCFDSSGATTHGTSCGGYFRKSKIEINGDNLGYCWWFLDYNFNAKRAYDQCSAFRARQTAVTTPGKARKLSIFIKDNIKLYASGKKGTRHKNTFKNGWPTGEVWVSDINNGRWKSTQRAVTDDTTKESIKKHGNQCVVFSHRKSSWRYASCSEKHPTICEDTRQTYPDDVGADDWTTPSVTLPPTRPHPKGLKLTCPKGYDEFMKHCFYIGKKRESLADAAKTCYKTGGNQVWISESAKYALVQRYVQVNKKKFPPPFYSAWLGRLEGNGYIIKWKSPGTNARYIINKYHLSGLKQLKEGILPNLYITSGGRVSRCGNSCQPTAAFCESTRIIPRSHNHRMTMPPFPTKPTKMKTIYKKPELTKSKPIHRKYKSEKPELTKSKTIHRKYKSEKSEPTESKPIHRKYKSEETEPTKSKPIHRKYKSEKPEPTKSKPIHRKYKSEKPEPTDSKPIHRKYKSEETEPTKSKPIHRKYKSEKPEPTKSKPIHGKYKSEKPEPTESKPIHRKYKSEETEPTKSKPIHRKHYSEKTKPRKSKPIISEKLEPEELINKKHYRINQKPTKLEQAYRTDPPEMTLPAASKPADVQEQFDYNAKNKEENNVPQDNKGALQIRKEYPEETEIEANTQDELNTMSRTPMGPLVRDSATTVTSNPSRLILLSIIVIFSTSEMFLM